MRPRLFLVILTILLLLINFSSFSYSQDSHEANWTFMVYMDADNSLHFFASDDLGEMMSVGSDKNLNIVVLYDSIKYGDSAIYYIERGQIKVLENLSEVDMGAPSTLEFFLNWTMQHYPAKHYFLDFWDHGDFYHGVCDDHGDWLTLEEMRNAISTVEQDRNRIINVIGFDACRMGIVENFYALRNLTNYVVASEKDEPASGWPYGLVLENMSNMSPQEAARNVINAMYSWSKVYFSKKGMATTMVAVNMTKFEKFLSVFNDNLMNMLPVTPYYYAQILNASRNAERYELYSDMDLYSFAKKLMKINDYKIDKFAEEIMHGLSNISYYKVWNCPKSINGVYANNSHGIGIYFPTFGVDPSYRSIGFARGTYWVRFLDLLFNPSIVHPSWGKMNYTVVNGKISMDYDVNASTVEIYLISNEKVYDFSILPPRGNFTLFVDYGSYKAYVYGYRNGYVVWARSVEFNYTKAVRVIGKFLLNGYLVKGANITLLVDNSTYYTLQNTTGFSFILRYPTEVRENSTMILRISYGSLHRSYSINATTLCKNNTLKVNINVFSLFFFPYVMMWPTLSIILLFLFIIFRKKHRKQRARRELKKS